MFMKLRKVWVDAMRAIRCGIVLLALCSVGAAANAQSLMFTRGDIADVTPGEDLWQNTYIFAGSLEAFGGLNLLYGPSKYGTLDVLSVAPELSPLVTQPDTGLGADGLITLTAAADQPLTYTTSFAVTYVKLSSLGDSHPYEIFDSNFNVVGGGNAFLAAVVPEPSSVALLLCGALVLAMRRRCSAEPPTR